MRQARLGPYPARVPGDLPIEQTNKFWLVVNLKKAKQLGIAFLQTC